MSEPLDPLLGIEDARHYLGGVSRATVYREVQRGKLRVTKVRGSTFFAQSELDRYRRAATRQALA